jgi:putative flavoprotein involved in K+ transport
MYVETAIIGGGFCGLNIALNLQEKGKDYLVIERGTLFNRWKNDSWNNFQLQTPHAFNRMHGQADDLDDKAVGKNFAEELAAWEKQVAKNNIRYKEGMNVLSVKKQDAADADNSRFVIEIESAGAKQTVTCKNVICCTGQFTAPKLPDCASKLASGVTAVHSKDFKGAEQFEGDKPILVVGSGQSGVQIADLLADGGRKVKLASSKVEGIFRSFRGEDAFVWLQRMGYYTGDSESCPEYAMLGASKAISFYSLARKGVEVLGSVKDVDGDKLAIEGNREENIAYAAAAYEKYNQMVKDWVAKQPADEVAKYGAEAAEAEWAPEASLTGAGPDELPLSDVAGVIWATGFGPNVDSYLKIDEAIAKDMNSVTGTPSAMISSSTPGLYYGGYYKARTIGSALLFGIEADAKVMADHIASN